jgi:hypothetical protein
MADPSAPEKPLFQIFVAAFVSTLALSKNSQSDNVRHKALIPAASSDSSPGWPGTA